MSSSSALISHIAANSSKLSPIPTGEEPILGKLEGIRAVVFDIYGTLFISGSGDISLVQDDDRSPAICASLKTAGYTVVEPSADWSTAFFAGLATYRDARKAEGIPYPEVRIEEIWEAFIRNALEQNWLRGSGDIRLAIVDHECRVNPCWPVPGLRPMLENLNRRKFPLGIVSNAQFYTPLMFPAFLGKTMPDLGFREEYSVWSYREREGKPSTALYQKLANALADDGVQPGEVLYIGNDLRNDIWPARNLGFKTVLFAGDQRSLRWRQNDPDCSAVQPDRVITDLGQLTEMVIPQS